MAASVPPSRLRRSGWPVKNEPRARSLPHDLARPPVVRVFDRIGADAEAVDARPPSRVAPAGPQGRRGARADGPTSPRRRRRATKPHEDTRADGNTLQPTPTTLERDGHLRGCERQGKDQASSQRELRSPRQRNVI